MPDSRRRTGSAGDAAPSGMSHYERRRRAEAVARECAKGRRHADVAAEFGLTRGRVSQIVKRVREYGLARVLQKLPRPQRALRDPADLVEAHACGFTLRELAEIYSLSATLVQRLLRDSGRYEPRRPGTHAGYALRVPDFVPIEHIDRWRRLAGGNGPAVADRCIRNLLAWEAR